MDSGNVISAATRVKGRVSGSGALTIAGHVDGEVVLGGPLDVASGARVEADVDATDVTVRGTVTGDVTGRRTVSLEASAVVEGDVTAPTISIDPAARLRGRVTMTLDLPRTITRGRW
ncbi:MAG: bactofilin family protein [Myxococcota bacterium]